jgi:hypothetical protein
VAAERFVSPEDAAETERMPVRTPQKVGVLGIVLIAAGASFTVLLPWSGTTLGGASYPIGVGLFAIGGALFFIGVVWAWVVGFVDATRAWDAVRKPLFCPACGQRYPGDQGHVCPKDGTELRPVA